MDRVPVCPITDTHSQHRWEDSEKNPRFCPGIGERPVITVVDGVPDKIVVDVTTDYVEIFRRADGDYQWRRRSANHEPVSGSLEGYQSKLYTMQAAERYNPGVLDFRDLTDITPVEVVTINAPVPPAV